ncbi:LysR family transcriptional regulator ArgP [Desulfovibrio mangrovi]|uniref:LysR family transcriptional regulator ArgP n=1 Tax=Desulfovibrio mangrovi TaxID=2976983 RepID=UPI0022462EF1|nr:LysR family transcriptional regulator ArgP [Desulfovibrio mangrovi]UZP67104.1 LysR family transcriptional regulator ArgP [Desulfovibrio mangrovi]
MLDYKQLEALAAVAEEGSFDKAAGRLHITQSAVSQRIRTLEDNVGQALLIRSTPVRPTETGQRLLAHFRKVYHLESDLLADLLPTSDALPVIALGVNEDSLATWFLPALQPFLEANSVLLDLYTDDQEQTHDLLRAGRVAGCVSTRPEPIQGCSCFYLGRMEYQCLATHTFAQRWFPNGVTAEAIRRAPAVTFNRKDLLHCRFAEHWGLSAGDFPTHYVPSSEVFVDLVTASLAYGMVPHPQGLPLIDQGTLVALAPQAHISVRLYWHQWSLGTSLTRALATALREGCGHLLL